MATLVRVTVSHTDASGKTLSVYGTQQYILNVNSVDENGITTALSNNAKKLGTRVVVHTYANLDKQYASSTAILS